MRGSWLGGIFTGLLVSWLHRSTARQETEAAASLQEFGRTTQIGAFELMPTPEASEGFHYFLFLPLKTKNEKREENETVSRSTRIKRETDGFRNRNFKKRSSDSFHKMTVFCH